MKNLAIYFALIFSISNAYPQVGIGTTTPVGALDITAGTSGVVVPRIALSAKNNAAPVANPQGGLPVDGTLIWNTATAGIPPNNVTPGFYFWNAGSWTSISGNIGREWSVDGNAVTNPAVEFIGTTSNQDFRLRTNNNERFTFSSNGRFRSHNDGDAGQPIWSWNADQNMGIFRIGADIMGISTNGTERFRFPNANQVHAMSLGTSALPFYSFGADPNTGIYSTAADELAVATGGLQRIRFLSNGQVTINNIGAPFATDQFSVLSTISAINGYSFGALDQGVYGANVTATGTGIIGAGNNTGGFFPIVGTGGAFTGTEIGLYAFSTSPGVARALYMADNFGAFWDAGYWDGTTYYKIIGPGAVSTIVKGLADENVVMHCTETPENLFEDYGVAKLHNGKAHIKLDPVFSKNILVDDTHPIKIFVQLEGECNGVYVTNKSATSFDVIELNNGVSNVPFSYSIVANRADEIMTGPDGQTRAVSYRARFEPAPKRQEALATTKNK